VDNTSIGLIELPDVRFSFFYGFRPFMPRVPKPDDYPKYLLHCLLPVGHADIDRVAAVINAVGLAKWKDNWTTAREQIKVKDGFCLHKGDTSKAGRPEYSGMFYISGSGPSQGRSRYTIVDADASPLVEADMRPYSGAYGLAKLEIWAQDNPNGKRVNCTVRGIQFLRHGTKLTAGAPPASPDEFTPKTAADAPAPTGSNAASDLV
jgi:hypothetical protein